VAEYRVVQVWKGAEKVGDTIRVRISPDPWEPQFPLALVGQRFVVAGLPPNKEVKRSFGCVRGCAAVYAAGGSEIRYAAVSGDDGDCGGSGKGGIEDLGEFIAKFGDVWQAGAALETLSQDAREKKLLDSYLKDYMTEAGMAEVRTALGEAKTMAEFEVTLMHIGSDVARDTLKRVDSFRRSILDQAVRPPTIVDWKPPTEEELQNAVVELKDIHSGRFFDGVEPVEPAAAAGGRRFFDDVGEPAKAMERHPLWI
jgi:hypothetical protein